MAESATWSRTAGDRRPRACRRLVASRTRPPRAAPATDAIQNSGFGRSWVITTATSAVAIGRIPSTTPPCEASTVCIASAIRNGNRMLTHSIAITSCGHSRRGGSGRRSTISSASEHSPAIAVRSAVMCERIDRRNRDARRRQRAAEDGHADKTQQQTEMFAKTMMGKDMVRRVSEFASTRVQRSARSAWRPCVSIARRGCSRPDPRRTKTAARAPRR